MPARTAIIEPLVRSNFFMVPSHLRKLSASPPSYLRGLGMTRNNHHSSLQTRWLFHMVISLAAASSSARSLLLDPFPGVRVEHNGLSIGAEGQDFECFDISVRGAARHAGHGEAGHIAQFVLDRPVDMPR